MRSLSFWKLLNNLIEAGETHLLKVRDAKHESLARFAFSSKLLDLFESSLTTVKQSIAADSLLSAEESNKPITSRLLTAINACMSKFA